MTKKLLCGIFVFALAMMSVSSAMAGDALTATQSVDGDKVSVAIEYNGKLTALGYQVTLPDGASLVSVDGDTLGIKPTTGASGTLDFAYIEVPSSPVTFEYTINGSSSGISAQVLYRRGAGDEIVVNVD